MFFVQLTWIDLEVSSTALALSAVPDLTQPKCMYFKLEEKAIIVSVWCPYCVECRVLQVKTTGRIRVNLRSVATMCILLCLYLCLSWALLHYC